MTCLKGIQICCLGTWCRDTFDGVGEMDRLEDLAGPFPPARFYDSMVLYKQFRQLFLSLLETTEVTVEHNYNSEEN